MGIRAAMLDLLRNTMTVLIVEDNAGVRRLLRRAVQHIATQIWECSDGEYALALYKEHRPNVVLMDVRMPIVDGLAATHQIRKFDPTARIIIVTDCEDDETRKAAIEAGASGFAVKQDLTSLAVLINGSLGI
jgi:two-component system chemotaxis response regulator CheY